MTEFCDSYPSGMPNDRFRAPADGWYEFGFQFDANNGLGYWGIQPGRDQVRQAGTLTPGAFFGPVGSTVSSWTGTGVVKVTTDAAPRGVLRLYVRRNAVVEFYSVYLAWVFFTGERLPVVEWRAL